MKYENDRLESLQKEYESKFYDSIDIDQQATEIHMNEKLSQLPIHQFLKRIHLIDLLWEFDAE